MGSNGLVAFIWTFHERSMYLGVLVGLFCAVIYALLMRRWSKPWILLGALTTFVGFGFLTNYISSRIHDVTESRFEAIRISEPPPSD